MVIENGYERLYVGKLVSDPKVSTFGEKQYARAKFGVRYADGKKGIIDVDTKFELAERCKDLKKSDGVIVLGKLDNWEDKNGNKRWFLNAEMVIADLGADYRAMSKTNGVKAEQSSFTEIADEELPFV